MTDESIVDATRARHTALNRCGSASSRMGSSTEHRLGMRQITIALHTSGPPQHRHAQHDEGFYVISDTARFTIGDRDHDAPAGQPMAPSAVAEVTASYATEPATEFAR